MNYDLNHPAVKHVLAADPHIHPLFNKVNSIHVTFFDDDFEFLIFSIIGQQLSTKVVSIIFDRLKGIYPNLNPLDILDAPFETLRMIGLSKQKITYMKHLSHYFHHSYKHFITLSKNEKINALLSIKGIGPWTTDMYIMFVLKEENHFSIGDLGLREALKSIYLKPLTTHQDILKATEKWSPYKSVVAHFLWDYWDTRHKGNKAV